MKKKTIISSLMPRFARRNVLRQTPKPLKLVTLLLVLGSLLLSGCTSNETALKPLPDSTGPAEPELTPLKSESTTPMPSITPAPTPEPTPEATPEATPTPEQPTESVTAPASNLSNSTKSWYYKPNDNHEPPGAQAEIDLSLFNAYYLGDTWSKAIYLTFDEGYENGYTPAILDTLKEKNVKAAFFLTKSYIKHNPELSKRIAEEGHLACNHSVTHPELPGLSDEEVIYEIEETARYFKEVTGYEMSKYFRPPAGVYSERTLSLTRQAGCATIFWSFAHRDWLVDDQPGKDVTYNRVMNNLHNGGILLLHAVSQSNTEALPDIIDSIRESGYGFKALDEINRN